MYFQRLFLPYLTSQVNEETNTYTLFLSVCLSLSLSLCLSLTCFLSFVCFGSESESLRKQGFWGSCRGNMYVPGKNIFISFHMNGARWAWFNVPWVWGVARLYSISYYLMGKKVYHYSEAPIMSTIIKEVSFMKKVSSFLHFLIKKGKGMAEGVKEM